MKKEMIKTFIKENTPILQECFKIIERFQDSGESIFFEELGQALDIIFCGAKALDLANLAEVISGGKDICFLACKVKDIHILISLSGLVSQVFQFIQTAIYQLEKGTFSDIRNDKLLHKLTFSQNSIMSSLISSKAS